MRHDPYQRSSPSSGVRPQSSTAALAEALSVPGMRLEYGPHRLEWMPDGLRDLDAAGRWLLELEARDAPDVVHLDSYALAAVPFARACVVVAHSCLSTWWRAVKREDPPADLRPYREAVCAGLEAASAVVAPSRAMRDALVDAYALDGRPMMVIHNGSELPIESAHHKDPFVFSAGRFWDDAKNLALLDRAADDLMWPDHSVRVRASGRHTHLRGCRRRRVHRDGCVARAGAVPRAWQ